MKISMISEHASPLAAVGGVDAGGQNVHVAALALALARSGEHEVTVYTRRDDARLPERVALGPGAEVVHVTAGPASYVARDELLPYMSALAEGVAKDWAANGAPALVHAHFWTSGLAALEASHRHVDAGGARVPVVQTFHALGHVKRRHQGAADTSPAERAVLEPDVARSVDAVIATCSDEVRELATLGVDVDRIAVAPCGVDLSLFSPNGEIDRRGTRHTIAAVGRMVPRKGVDLVIDAMARLREHGVDDLELLVVGGPDATDPDGLLSDPEITRLVSHACERGVGDQVRFLGRVDRGRLGAVMRSVDAVVCTPWYEPFGIVPLEAMACGVPVIATAVGGLLDTVVDGETGLLVPPRDVGALATAIRTLTTSRGLRHRLGSAGRARVVSRYTWERVADTTASVYRETVAEAAQQNWSGRRPVPAAVGAGPSSRLAGVAAARMAG